ncbi:nitrous oxide reductase accessory protein NosL [Oceanibacterium hippocampi]|uniref:NosL n=1 Tax=Oceanibacterium hippocampi TaxID=745714 RepID=A0A1Y5TID5_9PROT|nr:nitrous oxide reductase accessory protein NosL [Oceanibacterium hippocampi]SLN61043.1 NosL [Oceanibacterium hippocampi]
MIRLAVLLALILLAAGCRDETAATRPPAVTLDADALGHFCQMNLVEHPGPKAQIHLAGIAHPIFFSQVRDAIAYLRMPEQSAGIRAIYVNDMAAAPSWNEPGRDNWIAAEGAFFVIGSNRVGGMGAPEIVPFGSRAGADAFAARFGGHVAGLTDIPDEAVLAPVEIGAAPAPAEG